MVPAGLLRCMPADGWTHQLSSERPPEAAFLGHHLFAPWSHQLGPDPVSDSTKSQCTCALIQFSIVASSSWPSRQGTRTGKADSFSCSTVFHIRSAISVH